MEGYNMTNSDNKLILLRDNEGKAQIRYRKSDDQHWNTIYSDETKIDDIIDKLIESFNKING